jgi:hypothetical protein
MLNEPVYAPNCLGALLVWTQGDTAPYKVMWGFFEYPIGVKEQTAHSRDGDAAKLVNRIIMGKVYYAQWQMHLYDASGRRVMELQPGANDMMRLAPGVYFVRGAANIRLDAKGSGKVIITR